MKITITTTIDFTAPAASDQTSPAPMPAHAPATGRSSSAAKDPESPSLASSIPAEPLPFAEGIRLQTSDAFSDEKKWLRWAERGRLARLLDIPTLSPQEFDSIQKIVLAALEAETLQASPPAGPPPPPAPVGSSAFPQPNSGDFRFKANLESLFAALRRLP